MVKWGQLPAIHSCLQDFKDDQYKTQNGEAALKIVWQLRIFEGMKTSWEPSFQQLLATSEGYLNCQTQSEFFSLAKSIPQNIQSGFWSSQTPREWHSLFSTHWRSGVGWRESWRHAVSHRKDLMYAKEGHYFYRAAWENPPSVFSFGNF